MKAQLCHNGLGSCMNQCLATELPAFRLYGCINQPRGEMMYRLNIQYSMSFNWRRAETGHLLVPYFLCLIIWYPISMSLQCFTVIFTMNNILGVFLVCALCEHYPIPSKCESTINMKLAKHVKDLWSGGVHHSSSKSKSCILS